MNRRGYLLLLCLLLLLFPGCNQAEETEEARFTLRAEVCPPISSLDPAMNEDQGMETVFCAIYENLLRISEDGEGGVALAPGIAKEYREIVNFDGTVDYVFTLRSSARWSDGTRVSASDFAYAWQRLVDPSTDSPNHALLSMVQGYDTARSTGDPQALAVTADGDTVFKVTLSSPCSYFLSEICTAVPTMPLRKDVVTKDADWANVNTSPTNGPFYVGVWSKEEFIQLRRNKEYYDSRTVQPDVLRFVFASSDTDAGDQFAAGRVDYASPVPQARETSEQQPISDRRAICVFYNHMSELFSRKHIRTAFDLVLDREAIAQAVGPDTLPATGLVPYGIQSGALENADFRTEGGSLFLPESEDEQRAASAERELRLGGYWGENAFPATSILYVDEPDVRAAVQSAAGIWRERLNVSLTTEAVAQDEFDRRLAAGEYDLAVGAVSHPYGDAMMFLAPYAGTGGDNALHYANRPYELLIRVADTSRDPAARAAFLHDAEALLLEDVALSPLCFTGRFYALREGISGIYHDIRGRAYFAHASQEEEKAK